MLLKRSVSAATPSLDLTPVIDMVFLLLIFFLVATTFAQEEREMKIALPESASSGPISAALREIIVNVDRDGGIMVSGREVSEDDLRALVEEAVAANPEQKVDIRGDESAVYGSIMRVLDICKGAGVQQPYLNTRPAR